MTIITRFAPSPTGRIHVGNVRTALHNFLWARKHGGRFLLRIDDTDAERSTEANVEAIRADLHWLGYAYDGEARQSERFALYEKVFETLVASGRVYPAYETPQELDVRRKVLLSRNLPPVYERTALALTDADRTRLEAEGRRPHWRFKLDHGAPIVWTDAIRGEQRFDPRHLSDPVIRRADGSWLYLLPSVIDDIDMGVTDVVRGEDHVSNTATQVQMFAALDAAIPRFVHEALLTGAEGKLSKRLGALDMQGLRDLGIEPLAVSALLARLGTSDPVEPVSSLAPLIDHIDFARFGRAPARFDLAELQALNARIIHRMDFAAVADRLPSGMDAPTWDAIRPNIATVAEAADWWQVIEGPVVHSPVADSGAEDDQALLTRAAELLPTLDWAANPWGQLTAALKAETGRQGRALFRPLRLALTARESGPDMAALLPLIGQARARQRLGEAGNL